MTVPVVPWSEWYAQFARDYKVSRSSADHVTIVGPTGTGKTTLAMALARLRRYTVALGCKPKDAELSKLARLDGYRVQRHGDLPSPALAPRVLVWPAYDGDRTEDVQRQAFDSVLSQAFDAGGWHIVCEEAPHLIDIGLGRRIRRHLRMGRSMSSGLILCTQRPRGLPLEAMSNAQHLLIFGTNDVEDLKRLGGMNGVDPATVRQTVAALGRSYDFLHVNTRTGNMQISRYVPRKGR